MQILNSREAIIALTPRNPFGRFLDGRPHVPDDLLERMLRIPSDQAWALRDTFDGLLDVIKRWGGGGKHGTTKKKK